MGMRDIDKVGCSPIFSEVNLKAYWLIPSHIISALEVTSHNLKFSFPPDFRYVGDWFFNTKEESHEGMVNWVSSNTIKGNYIFLWPLFLFQAYNTQIYTCVVSLHYLILYLEVLLVICSTRSHCRLRSEISQVEPVITSSQTSSPFCCSHLY